MSISTSSVLWGIEAPYVHIHQPGQGLNLGPEETKYALAQVNLATLIGFETVGEQYEAKSRRLISHPEGFRVRFKFRYQYIEPAAAILWGKIWNYHIAGFKIRIVPHYDAALKLDWEVLPAGNFDLGFVADKYIAHQAEFDFISTHLQPAVLLKTAVNTFGPITHP